jgi:hypothetical protein
MCSVTMRCTIELFCIRPKFDIFIKQNDSFQNEKQLSQIRRTKCSISHMQPTLFYMKPVGSSQLQQNPTTGYHSGSN